MVYVCGFCRREFTVLMHVDLLIMKEHVLLCELQYHGFIQSVGHAIPNDPEGREYACTNLRLVAGDNHAIIKTYSGYIRVTWPDLSVSVYSRFDQALNAMKRYIQAA